MIRDKYIFYKMIDSEKNVSIVQNVENGKNYVQKEYSVFNKDVFEHLKLARIDGIPRVYEIEEVGSKLITIEEYVRGENLQDRINRDGSMDEEEALDIVLKVCVILKELHSLEPPIIHRDIKPANIILTKSKDVYLIDFNASREYKDGYSQDTVLFGTRDFAAPEQLGYGDSDARTDIFGLGATMNYMLSQMHFSDLIAPGKYSAVISKCCKNDKENRYQSVDELEQALMKA